jgi:membrane protein
MSSNQRRRAFRGTAARVEALSRRGHDWIERQDPARAQGVAIGAWQRYRAVDGPLQSVLLSMYLLIAVLPALLVMEEYLETDPAAFSNHMVRQYGLSAPTASLLRGVLVRESTHKLGSALLAVAGALFFGLGFGRVLQLVHARAWQLTLPAKRTDQARYAAVLIVLYGLILLLVVQTAKLAGGPSWAGLALAPGWVALLLLYFLWAARLLTYKLIARRNLLPGAALTSFGLVALMLISGAVMEPWVDFYAKDYGGFGVIMAVFFWIAFSSTVIVGAASFSPPLAVRRDLRRAQNRGPRSHHG